MRRDQTGKSEWKHTIIKTGMLFCLLLAACFAMPRRAMAAKPSASKVTAAYNKYYRKHYVGHGYRGMKAIRYDFNKDGIEELYICYESGVRGAYELFTYKNGKVVKMHDTFYGCQGVSCYKNKYIAVSQSESAFKSYITIYKIKGKKMSKIAKYTFSNSSSTGKVKCYRNGKRISKEKYYALDNKMVSIY